MKTKVFGLFIIFMLSSVTIFGQKFDYPKANKVNQIDDYHGTKVADPYRGLENPESPESREWITAQNKITDAYLTQIPEREAIKNRLTKLWNYEKYSAPFKVGKNYFYSKNDGLQNQSILYIAKSITDAGRVFIDPNKLSKDGTVALSGTVFTDDGALVAIGTATAGSDQTEWKVMEVETGKYLDDKLEKRRQGVSSWLKDGSGFFYSAFPKSNADTALRDQNFYQKLYFHKLGSPSNEDVLIYDRPDDKEFFVNGGVTEDGNFLIINVGKGTSPKNMVYYKSLSNFNPKTGLSDGFQGGIDIQGNDANAQTARRNQQILPLITDLRANYSFIGNDGRKFYFLTDDKASFGQVVVCDTMSKMGNWSNLIPEAKETLQGVDFINNQLVTTYLKDAYSQIRIYNLNGKFVRDVALPGIGTASGFGGKRMDSETFYSYSSFNAPPTIFRYNMKTGKSTLFREAKVDFNRNDYEVKQVFYNSKDGTKVPMFIVHKKGIKMDGNNPTMLYGYGGFNVNLTPGFSVSRLVWLEMGGIYAVPNLRGGAEYGETWWKGGSKMNKQNTFDDFAWAAKYLIAENYTQPSKLAISGGSNGGLLVGATLNQHPELFGAALPAVGVMDMLRYQSFTIGWAWTSDYGDVKIKEEFNNNLKFSPLHNIKKGGKYPAVMVTTSDHDDRVVPAHSFKYTATLQENQGGDKPILIRIEVNAGHGAGKPTAKVIQEQADVYGFLVRELGMQK
jgi:prolyl oligopeptidase